LATGWFGSIPVLRKVEALIRPICPFVCDNIKGPWFFFSITFNCGDSSGELRIALTFVGPAKVKAIKLGVLIEK